MATVGPRFLIGGNEELESECHSCPFGSSPTFLSLTSVCHWLEVVTEWVLMLFLHGLLASLSLDTGGRCLPVLAFGATGLHEHRSFFPQSFCICNLELWEEVLEKGGKDEGNEGAGYICPVDISW